MLCFQFLMVPLAFLAVLVAFAGESGAQDRSLLQLARDYIQKRNPEKAEILLRDYVRQNERDPDAHYLLGLALSELGKREESNSYLERALALDKTLKLALRSLGINAFDSGNFEVAREYLEDFLKETPGDELTHVLLARVALAKKDFPRAVQHFSQVKVQLKMDARLQLLSARALVGADQIEEGKKTLRSIRSNDPILLFDLGLALAELALYKEAIENFTKARQGYPDPSVVDFNLALTYFQTGDYHTAISLLEQMVKEKRADADVFSLLGDTYLRVGRPREAYNSLQMAVFLAPEQERHYIDLLGLCLDIEEVEAGLEIANLALKRHPQSYEIYAQRAMLYFLKNQLKLAKADYRTALQLSPKTERLYTSFAMLLMFDDHLEEAKALLESHLEEFRSYHSYYIYSEVLSQMGLDRSLVQRLLETSVRLNPNFSPARLSLGRVYAAQQNWPNAVTQLQAAITSDPGDKRAYYDLYQIYMRTGSQAKAQEMLEIVRRLNEEERDQAPDETIAKRIHALRKAAGVLNEK